MNERPCLRSVLFYFFALLPSVSFSQQSHFILAIGDSHGVTEMGWVNQLRKLRPYDSILNVAISGNTIGFDNLGQESLNEMKNIHLHLNEAERLHRSVDYIIVLLGTNDCKAIFGTLQSEVPGNLERLIRTISGYKFQQRKKPGLILATPPPIADDARLEAKYLGGSNRLKKILPYYESISIKYQCKYVDTYDLLAVDFTQINKDGIHLTKEGYRRIAEKLNQVLNSTD